MSHPKCYVLNCVMCNFGQFVVFLKTYPISMHVSRMITRIINTKLAGFCQNTPPKNMQSNEINFCFGAS